MELLVRRGELMFYCSVRVIKGRSVTPFPKKRLRCRLASSNSSTFNLDLIEELEAKVRGIRGNLSLHGFNVIRR